MTLRPYLHYNKLLLIFLFISLAPSLFGQKKIKESKWVKKYLQPSQIPDSLHGLDAVSIFYHQKVTVYVDPYSGGKTTFMVNQRFKILTEEGKQFCNKFTLVKPKRSDIMELDAVTIKPNGELVHFKTSDLKQVSEKFKTENGVLNRNEYKIAIPNVSIGDEVELRYQLALPYLLSSEDLYFNTDFHSINSTITLSFEKHFKPDIRMFNGLEAPKEETNYDYVNYIWRKKSVRAKGNSLYSIPAFSEPYLSYSIRYFKRDNGSSVPIVKNAWGFMYENVEKYLDLNNPSAKDKKSLDSYLYRVKSKHSDDSKMHLLQALIDSLNTFKIVREEFLPKDFSLTDMLAKKRISNISLYGIYLRAFEVYHIPFDIGLLRNKYEGLLYSDYVSVNHITDFMYVVKDNNNQYVFLYPSTSSRTYRINEYPFQFEKTNVVLVNKSCINNLNPHFKFSKIPSSKVDDNYASHRYRITVDPTDTNHIIEGETKLSGHLNHHYYKNDSVYLKKLPMKFKSLTQIDRQELSSNYPYKVTFQTKGTCNLSLKNINDSLFILDIKSLLDHKYPKLPIESKRELHYFGPFPYSNSFQYAIEFPYDIKLVTPISFSAINGMNYMVKQQESNLIYVSSTYKMASRFIRVNDYVSTSEGIEQYKQELGAPIYLQKLLK
ncbi:MAG: DUF3857 domain-containing protein [Salibacteraceae bacterium]